MINKTNFKYSEKIENAIIITNEKHKKEPNNPMYPHIEKILNLMKNIINENTKITEKNNIGNELGMLVVRRIDDEDPDYADILIEISDNFESDFLLENN